MKNFFKKVSSIIVLGGTILSCGEEEFLTKEHQERLQAKTIQVSKLNDFYETFDVFVSIVFNEAYLSTVLSRVDGSQKISLVIKSRDGQVVHNQDLRVKNGKTIVGIKPDSYQITSQVDKNSYGKITLYTLSKRTLKDIIANSREDHIFIDFLGFNYKIEVEKLREYIKVVDDVLNEIWDQPVDLSEGDGTIAIPRETDDLFFEEVENEN